MQADRRFALGLRLKFNIVLLLVFLLGLAVSAYVSRELLQRNARAEVLHTAGVMMEAALSMRSYTVGQVRPNLRPMTEEFLPQSVPAYAATEIMGKLHETYPNYAYKEAALNPTNPRDRAVSWEADIINEFRNNTDRKEFSGVRDSPTGLSMFLARPLQIKDANCLACHTTAEASPPSMVRLYGSSNGFGWKLNEIVGAQIVSVPMSLPIRKADSAFLAFMASLTGVFIVLFVILNVMLSILIVRPIRSMSAAADKISVGEMDIPELPESGKDEVATLGKSFNRMRRSLEKAISLINDP